MKRYRVTQNSIILGRWMPFGSIIELDALSDIGDMAEHVEELAGDEIIPADSVEVMDLGEARRLKRASKRAAE